MQFKNTRHTKITEINTSKKYNQYNKIQNAKYH